MKRGEIVLISGANRAGKSMALAYGLSLMELYPEITQIDLSPELKNIPSCNLKRSESDGLPKNAKKPAFLLKESAHIKRTRK